MEGMGQAHRRSQFVALAGSRGSITLPVDVRRRYHLDEPGAQVQVIGRPDGVIELHPVLPHRADQAWFWTERWQAMEGEAEEDIAAGRTRTFDSAEEFVSDLDREAAERDLH
jgi:bifunctional DNA-binding transcriptional regulator/antitoxin component of YhaV-PrlF toxin-antitoxin module